MKTKNIRTGTGVWIPTEWQQDTRLSPTDLMILAKVYSYTQNDFSYCYASSKQLLPIGDISQSTFDRSKKHLAELGIFEIRKAKSKWRQIVVHIDRLQFPKDFGKKKAVDDDYFPY